MIFYKPQEQYQYFCGIDLHTKRTDPGPNDAPVQSRSDWTRPVPQAYTIASGCLFEGYRSVPGRAGRRLRMRLLLVRTGAGPLLADLCEDEGIEFVLGHALYMKAVHGGT